MMPLKNLLKQAVGRARITRQINAAIILESVNETLLRILPENRRGDASAMSFKNGTILFYCLNSAVARHISTNKDIILDELKKRYPGVSAQSIRTKITQTIDQML